MRNLTTHIFFLLACIGLVSGCGLDIPKGRGSIKIKSTPEQAEIYINGAPQGMTPATISGLAADDYTIELRKDSYESAYNSVSLLDGQQTELDLQLKKVTGLLLVESNPQGADVVIDGVSRGNTPLLLTDLPLGSYKIEFHSPTQLPRTMAANLVNRRPVHVFAELISNTATLVANSTPEGAEVRINGVLVGTTPATIEEVLTGESDVRVSKRGYTPFNQPMTFEATQRYEINPALESLPAGLTVITSPEGARVMVDKVMSGISPLTLKNLKGGDHEIIVNLEGFATQTNNITLEPEVNDSIEFNLVKDSGYLVIATEPANVQIYINGLLLGMTQPKGGSSTLSQPVRITLKSDIEHKIQLVCEGYVASLVNITTEIDQVITRHEILKRIFVRDTMITTDKEVIKCRLEYKLPNGNIYYERYPGVFDTVRAADIRNIQPIGIEDESNREARRRMEQNRQAVPGEQ
jgi:hypothetical protein